MRRATTTLPGRHHPPGLPAATCPNRLFLGRRPPGTFAEPATHKSVPIYIMRPAPLALLLATLLVAGRASSTAAATFSAEPGADSITTITTVSTITTVPSITTAPTSPAEPTESGPSLLKQYNFAEEAGLVVPGDIEFEQDCYLSLHQKSDHGYSQFAFCSQLSYSFTERFQLTLIAPEFSTTRENSKSTTTFDGVGFDVYYAFTDPATCPVGISLYQALTFSSTNITSDSRLILAHDEPLYNFTYNLGLSNDLQGLDGPHSGDIPSINHSFALAHTFHFAGPVPLLSVGFESTVNSAFKDYNHYTQTTAYAGPTIAFNIGDHLTLVLSSLYELTDTPNTPRWQFATALVYSF